LPERKEPIIELGEHTREFVSELKVTDKYQNVGKTIEEAGLRHLKGLFLFQIEREGKIMAPARPNETLQLGDRLFFTGIPKTIVEFQKTEGLQLIKDTKYNLKQYDSDEIKTYETVISPSSPLIGKNVRESNFRGRYNAVILAIHRNGERIKKKIGDIVIRPGDTLLLLADKYFLKKWYNSKDFYLVSGTTGTYSKPQWNAKLSIFLFLGMILLTVLNVLPLITAAGLAAIVLILSRSISPSEVKNMVDWRVLIIIAGAIGIAQAIDNSGMARLLSNLTVNYVKPFGVIGILAGLYFMTSICTSLITNIAAAAFLFPIALSTALALNLDIRPFVLTITIAAAASFATPFSYQTNLMVYGPGGYKFRDYLRIGLPLQIIIGIVAVWLINMIYF
jgi:di/tricarboxylate transporter